MPFQKGNKLAVVNKGQKKTKTLEAEREEEVLRDALRPFAKEIALVLVNEARKGEVSAIKEFNDRLYGKVKEKIEHSGSIELENLTEGIKKLTG